ncbi:unannotated protein [freshwater metagenome]|uniref:Unannotated protein n=1 Tax=freshwater metagenome TaxID=449393 RepID=A0A6J6I959_9ZZZZ
MRVREMGRIWRSFFFEVHNREADSVKEVRGERIRVIHYASASSYPFTLLWLEISVLISIRYNEALVNPIEA